MSASRSPSSPNTSSTISSGPISGSTLVNTTTQQPLTDLDPSSSPEKHQDSPSSSPLRSPGDNRQLAPRPVNERGSLDDVTHVNGDNPDPNPLAEHDISPVNASNGDSSPMELVDEEMGGALELEDNTEYIDSYDMQDLRRVKVCLFLIAPLLPFNIPADIFILAYFFWDHL